MASLKIAVKIAQLPDIKVKLKIEVENNPKSIGYLPQEMMQASIDEPCGMDSPVVNQFHAEIPEVTVHSGSFWRDLFSWLKFWRRS
jgi:hypothetical protein